MIAVRTVARAVLCSALVAGCTNTGVHDAVVPLHVAGTSVTDPIAARDDWQVVLSRVDVAFGPLVLCGGVKAGELCDTARAEWLDSVVIDALDVRAVPAGHVEGTSGVTRSWMYDHGITSLLTQQAPLHLAAADALGGSSVVIEGSASKDDVVVAFSARIAVQQEEDTEIGVPVVRKSASDLFEHDITGDEAFLLVRFDVRSWFGDVDFSALAEVGNEHTLAHDSQGVRAIRNAVVAGTRPTFEWGTPTTQEKP